MSMNAKALSPFLLAGSALGWLVGCGAAEPASGSTDLASAVSSLEAAQGSLDEARAEAKACFEAYRACEDTAGEDAETCRAQLKACLPAQPPVPAACRSEGAGAPAVSSDAGEDRPERRQSRGGSPFGGDEEGGDRAGKDCDKDEGAPPTGDEPPTGDQPPTGDEPSEVALGLDAAEEDDTDTGHDEGAQAAHCRAPDMPKGALGACREHAASDLQSGAAPSDAAATHQACVSKNYGDKIAELCKKAAQLCADPSAPAEICARVTDACSADGDAGI